MIEPSLTRADAELAVRLLDESPDGLLLIDAAGIIVLASRSASALFGLDDGDSGDSGDGGDGGDAGEGIGLVGQAVDDLVPEDQRAGHAALRAKYAAHPRPRSMGSDLELFGRRADGHVFPVEISLSPIMIDGAAHTVATVRDVSERQESRAKLLLHEERERIAHELHDLVIQRLFASGMSLQSVTNLIESTVARDRVVAVTDEMDETVRAIRSAIFRIGIRDDAQSLESHLTGLIAERTRHLSFQPAFELVGSLDDLPDFIADQLVATLTEALTNVARHAAATAATVRITRTAGSVSLVVRDNGRGMPEGPKSLGGISNLMWRAAELGGSCTVAPAEPRGTELVWQIPV